MEQKQSSAFILLLNADWRAKQPKSDATLINLVLSAVRKMHADMNIIARDKDFCAFSLGEDCASFASDFPALLQKAFSVTELKEVVRWELVAPEQATFIEKKDPLPRFDFTLTFNEKWLYGQCDEASTPLADFIKHASEKFLYFKEETRTDKSCNAQIRHFNEEIARKLLASIAQEVGASTEDVRIELKKPQPEAKVSHKEVKSLEIKARIDALIGAQGLKDFAAELMHVSPALTKHETQSIFAQRCLLYSIGEGCGVTTQLNLLAELMQALGLVRFEYGHNKNVDECRIKTFNEALHSGSADPYAEFVDKLNHKQIQLKCINLNNQLDRLSTPEFRSFLRQLSKYTNYYFVFQIPFVDEETRAHIKSVLNNVFPIREVVINPYTIDDFRTYAQHFFSARNFSLNEAAWRKFELHIINEKQNAYFYNFATIRTIAQEFLYQKYLAPATENATEFLITEDDLQPVFAPDDDRCASAQLDDLIGMQEVKQKILELADQLELAAQNSAMPMPCLHMQFTGNPGTGKTTIARILGKLLQERKLLSVGGFFEHFSRDLCGRYIGETAPKTAAICRDAYGSVLFIDEAYSLYRGTDNTRDYGSEAIDTLIAQMENHRQDFMVIMAGYQDDMKQMLESNVGLASRIPHVVHFPNYTREDLSAIFLSMASKTFTYDDDFIKTVQDYFHSLSDDVLNSKTFSNARFVRNLFERTWGKASTRIRLETDAEMKLLATDFDKAIADREFNQLQEKKLKQIGF